MAKHNVQYITDADGQNVGVIVPIELWREMTSERAVGTDAITKRQQKAGERAKDLTLEEAGIEISSETGLPVFRLPPDAPKITTEFVKQLEDDW